MHTKVVFVLLSFLVIGPQVASGQDEWEPGNKIDVWINLKVMESDSVSIYHYEIGNAAHAKQDLVELALIMSKDVSIAGYASPKDWRTAVFHDTEHMMVRWFARASMEKDEYVLPIKPGASVQGFSLVSKSVPGFIIYYAEGDHPIPSFPEGMATDSIPGYTDLTPYGPGIVGKTVGPVLPPDPFFALVFLDTLLSYIHQSHHLGWINNTRDDDAEEDEKAEDGIVKNLDKRLGKIRDLVDRDKIPAARSQLQRFLRKVERLWDRQQNEDKRNRKNPRIIFTSEAYALLKYNGEYLLDHLTEAKEEKKDKKRKEK
jgi:hypothetical protein